VITVCYGCTPETGRHVGCHGTCEMYIQEKAEYEAQKQQAKSQHQETYKTNTNGTYYAGKNPRRGGHRKFNI